MKARVFWIAIAATLLGGVTANAQRDWFVGLNLGVGSIDVGGVDEVTQAGILFGYRFFKMPLGSFSGELEFTTTVAEADIDLDIGLPDRSGEFDIDTLGVYAAYRGGGLVFFKGRVGIVSGSASARGAGGLVVIDDSSTEPSFGIGVGVRLGIATLEANLTRTTFASDYDYVSVGVTF